jgi:hypothetical protein
LKPSNNPNVIPWFLNNETARNSTTPDPTGELAR